MTIKIENNQLFETAYIEEIIKENIIGAKITPVDSFGNITIQRGAVIAEVQCQITNNSSLQYKNTHDPFIPQHGATFVNPVRDTDEREEEKVIEGVIEITSEVKTSYWIRILIAAIFIVPFNVFYLKQAEVSTGMKVLFYVMAFGIASIPEELKRQKYAKGQKELQQLLVNLINEHNLTSSPEEKSTANDDDDKYNLLPEE